MVAPRPLYKEDSGGQWLTQNPRTLPKGGVGGREGQRKAEGMERAGQWPLTVLPVAVVPVAVVG